MLEFERNCYTFKTKLVKIYYRVDKVSDGVLTESRKSRKS